MLETHILIFQICFTGYTYKKYIYNFFTYVCLGTHILKTHILIFYICMSGYIYTKNTYINFPNMFKYKKTYMK